MKATVPFGCNAAQGAATHPVRRVGNKRSGAGACQREDLCWIRKAVETKDHLLPDRSVKIGVVVG